jgi:hypothetical protein
MSVHAYVGVDLAIQRDYTAICVLVEMLYVAPRKADFSRWRTPGGLGPIVLPDRIEHVMHTYRELAGPPGPYGTIQKPPLQMVYLDRYQGVPFDDIVRNVGRLLRSAPMRRFVHYNMLRLLVDRTGLGAPVIDNLWASGLYPWGIHILRSDTSVKQREDYGYNVPINDLIGAVQTLIEANPSRLRIPPQMPYADTLVDELRNFEIKPNKTSGNDTYEAHREGDHDDLVFALSMCAWMRHCMNVGWEGMAGYPAA